MKLVLRVLWALLLGLITFFVVMMSQIGRVNQFRAVRLNELISSGATQQDINNFLVGITAFERATNSFHLKTPIFSFSGYSINDNLTTSEQISARIHLDVFLVHQWNEGSDFVFDSILFLLSGDLLMNIGTDNNPVIATVTPSMVIEFNEALRYRDNQGNVHSQNDADGNPILSVQTTFSGVPFENSTIAFHSWAFPIGLRRFDTCPEADPGALYDTFVDITRVNITYRNQAGNVQTLLSIANNGINNQLTPNNDLIQNTNDSRFFTLNKDNMFLSRNFTLEQAQTSPYIYVSSFDLSPYNFIIWRNSLIWGAIGLGLTYLLFFHKLVMESIRERRAEKAAVVGNTKIFDETNNKKTIIPIFSDDYEENQVKKKRK